MTWSAEAGRRYWREVMLAGGSSVLPRWRPEPPAGSTPGQVLEHQVPLDPELVDRLREVAGDLAVSLSSLLLAGHARVLSALCGSDEVVSGYVATGAAEPLPCRLATDRDSWRGLLAEAFATESAVLTHRDVPLAPLRADLGVAGPLFESVFDPTGGDGLRPSNRIGHAPTSGDGHAPTNGNGHVPTNGNGHAPANGNGYGPADESNPTNGNGYGPANGSHPTNGNGSHPTNGHGWAEALVPGLSVGVVRPDDGAGEGGGLLLRLRCRADVWDAAALARVGGYHRRALELIAADVGADPAGSSLLSAEELRFQLQGLAGPHRPLPNRRVHELIEQRVAEHPDRVAAVHGERRWTYRELNAHANRLARALLARGLPREGVVAVVCERDLDWMAAVLAILKAGGAYLPIEPHFPADRIATTVDQSGCRWVITEPGATDTLDQALDRLPGVRVLYARDAYAEGHEDTDLGVEVTADQLAYIYFTSGSTGRPKGAMCEHAGMLNHILAKIADTELGPGGVLAQTAPQCFDISLWQLLAAPMVGGTTLLVEQDTILDVARFVDTLAGGRVTVAQLVPSYLETVLSYLEREPRELPDLRYVSTTGEALKKELTVRWFAAQPGIALVNAYGLTETSDDTNHEVLRRPPDTDRVPLGPPIPNVHIYLVDEHLRPVPLGAPGEIVYSGVCVGRGYVNDPERTGAAYLPDPHRAGERLYRGGDIGRWLPDGKLEFLGRRDSQVKVRGFRIEIGEVENALLRASGVRDGAVVVVGAGHSAQLVAFYTGTEPVPAPLLRERLGRSLPDYMLPSGFHWRESLPLTANSKIDHKALTVLAAELASDSAADPDAVGPVPGDRPRTATERRLAAAWATVLGIPADQIGREDDFFDRGGTSLSAVKLAITLNRAVSLKDITTNPTLGDLAGLIDHGAARPPDSEPASAT